MLYRVYFNRTSDAPLVWSVDEGTQETEQNFESVTILNANVTSRWNPQETVNQFRPKAWLEVEGTLHVANGVAVIEGEQRP